MIHRLFNIIFSKRVLQWLIAIFSVFYLLSLYHRYIQQDEPWFGEQAYWLLKEGEVKIKSMPGIFNWTESMLIYHKLFVWIGALIISIFGWSLYPLKAFILLVFLASCWLLISFLKKYQKDSHLCWVAAFLLITTPELIHRSFMFRPEVVVMCLGFLSFYMLYRTIDEKRGSAHWAGLFSGLAFLTHLNALIFPVAGFLLLMCYKKWQQLVIYTVICGAVCSVYTIGLWDAGHIETYTYQMQHWPTHQKAFGEKVDGGIIGIIWNNISRLLNEHKRYFWDQDVWMISAFFLLSLIVRFRFLWRQHRLLLGYTLILMVLLGVLGSGHSPRYLVYLMPFMTVLSALVVQNIAVGRHVVLKMLLVLVLLGQLGIVGITFKKIYTTNYNHVALHHEILSVIEPGSKVLAPWEFIYNEIDNYALHSYKTYEYIEDQEKMKLTQNELLALAANRFEMDYIVIDEKRKRDKNFSWFYDCNINDNPHYEFYREGEGYLILKKK
ncbi:hypothetical protein C900_01008 [Fulvivirga imtechensis AK7]|uniref:Glycosyltransferase RgtA/B/C/D-like domain-containing protein n=1 Tax=Fulvivirga imtechensis AK7 TaxID=1237149 RepID=L8JYA2_9BACT|nr:glycosyltransferase family 39 protein [Fulvivirga imtechensis]ELR72629.1 hypothetical protein C900_01008 [Fulvivirga imtechensis AK7]